jgi:hypothetical protein
MTMRTLLAIASVGVLAALGVLAFASHSEPATSVVASSTVESRRESVSTLRVTGTEPTALAVTNHAELEQHEQALVARARSTTRPLERDEMLQLHRAIDTLELDPATRLRMHRELTDRLRLLAREIELAPTHGELSRLLEEIRTRGQGAPRDRLAAAYRLAARNLPPMYSSDALARLDVELGHGR